MTAVVVLLSFIAFLLVAILLSLWGQEGAAMKRWNQLVPMINDCRVLLAKLGPPQGGHH